MLLFNWSVQTTSQNADAFWKKWPGFVLDKLNPTDYIFQPQNPAQEPQKKPSRHPFFSLKITRKKALTLMKNGLTNPKKLKFLPHPISKPIIFKSLN